MKLSKQYMAGFFDGEGCVNMGRTRSSVFPRILLVNTNREILEAFQEMYGGDIASLSLRKENWKQGWMWRLSWGAAVEFLRDILPYLIIKEEQALTAIAWSEASPGTGGRWDGDCRQLLFDRMKWLNAKGPSMGEDPIEPVLRELSAIALSEAGKSKRKR